MRVLIGTPAGGGQVHIQYLLSYLDTHNANATHKQEVYRKIVAQIPNFDESKPEHRDLVANNMRQFSYDVGIYTLGGESLLGRGRNHIAQTALAGGWDKLFFIDADGGWTPNDFFKIVQSPHPIIAGVVPLKVYPNQPANFETALNFLPFLEDEIYFDNSLRTLQGLNRMVRGHGSPIVKVAFTGTAFLCIDCNVLAQLAQITPEYLYPNPSSGQPEVHWDFFGGGPSDGSYLSEDWAFCTRARNIGYDIMIDSEVRLTHTGNHTFKAG